MFKTIFGFCFRWTLYIFAFIMLVWVFLGIPPTDSLKTANDRVWSAYQFMAKGTFLDDITKTAGDMKRVANRELNQAAERIDGKDPYEDFNNQLGDMWQEQKDAVEPVADMVPEPENGIILSTGG